ncbi:MAG: DUF1636 domain-containing protein [Hyphomicrobiales bacterium]|nr:DUF1636 domain-containing protein [Hyphomicrobiales bacterium]
MTEKTKVLVCIKCRMPGESKETPFDQRTGGRLYREVAAAAESADDLEIVPVECFSVCKRPVTIGLAAAGKWRYLYGDYPLAAADDILAAARIYAKSQTGIVPFEERSESMKTGVVSRIPPGL